LARSGGELLIGGLPLREIVEGRVLICANPESRRGVYDSQVASFAP
jgi:hypothetical protein